MMKLSWCAVAFMVVSGCVCTRPCGKDSDCDNGGVCDRDYNFCVAPPDAGQTDGGPVAGDGSVIDGGRDSGMVELVCPNTCNAWESCEDSAAGHVCRSMTVTFGHPADGEVFDAGETVQFVVYARGTDGGDTGRRVPLESSYGSVVMATSGNNTPVPLPLDAGTVFTFTAGWANASHSSISISTKYCAVQCQPWQECRPTTSGGVCESANLRLAWVTPDEGLSTNANSVIGTVLVTRADGGAFTVASVPVHGPTDSTLTPNAGAYSGMLTFTGEGDQVFTAGWNVDGGATAVRKVIHDTLPPVVTVTPIDRPNTMPDGEVGHVGFWKKDEKPLVRVNVDGARAPVVGDLSNAFSGAMTKVANSMCPACDAMTCGCFDVDVAKAPLDKIRGQLAITVGVFTDAAGNSSTAKSLDVNVTRFKWSRPLGTSATITLRPIGVSSTGIIVAGSTEGAPHRLSAFAPDGGIQWEAFTDGAISAGPAIGTDNVFVTPRVNDDSWIQPIALRQGALGPKECPLNIVAGFVGDMGLATVVLGTAGSGITGEAPLAIRGPALRVGDGNCNAQALDGQTGRPSLALREAGGGVLDVFTTSDASILAVKPNLWKSQLQNTVWQAAGNSSITFPLLAPTLRPISGILLDGTLVVGTANDGSFTDNASGPLSTASFTKQAASPAPSPPVAGAGYLVFGDTSGQLHKVTYSTAGVFGTPVVVGSTVGESLAAPIIGSDGLIYAVGSLGSVSVHHSSDLSLAWSTTALVTGVTSVGHPALDVYRDETGGKACGKGMGVLYFSTFDGAKTNLIAVLVDSNGLEPTAPWPKYQRDNGNTGNFSRPLTPWTCP